MAHRDIGGLVGPFGLFRQFGHGHTCFFEFVGTLLYQLTFLGRHVGDLLTLHSHRIGHLLHLIRYLTDPGQYLYGFTGHQVYGIGHRARDIFCHLGLDPKIFLTQLGHHTHEVDNRVIEFFVFLFHPCEGGDSLVEQVIEGIGQGAEFITTGELTASGEITFRYQPDRVVQSVQGTSHTLGQQHQYPGHQDPDSNNGDDKEKSDPITFGPDTLEVGLNHLILLLQQRIE